MRSERWASADRAGELPFRPFIRAPSLGVGGTIALSGLSEEPHGEQAGDANDRRTTARGRVAMFFAREHPSREEILTRVRDRSFAIAMSSAALGIFASLTGAAAYSSNGPNLLLFAFICFVSALIGFMIGTEASMARLVRGLNLPDPKDGPDASKGRPGNSQVSRLAVVAGVSLMFTAILLDFWAVGYLLRTTGGVIHSPYNTVPATMLILGGIMTRNDTTRIALFIAGVLFFLAVHSSSLFGTERTPLATRSFGTFEVFLVVTAVNLVVSYVLASRSQAVLPPRANGSTTSDDSGR
jgi:hypothetical protein